MKARTVKFIFIGSAVGLTLLMFMWPVEKENRLSLSPNMKPSEGESKPLTRTDVKGITSTVMESPHFSGEDEKGRMWNIEAKEAIQQQADTSETMVLNEINGFSIQENGEKYTFEADSALLQSRSEDFTLKGRVRLMGRGYTLKTSEINSNLKSMAAYSNERVYITSTQGVLEAGRFNIHPDGDKIEFDGGVKVRFIPKSSEVGE